jgi:hypothetical protein
MENSNYDNSNPPPKYCTILLERVLTRFWVSYPLHARFIATIFFPCSTWGFYTSRKKNELINELIWPRLAKSALKYAYRAARMIRHFCCWRTVGSVAWISLCEKGNWKLEQKWAQRTKLSWSKCAMEEHKFGGKAPPLSPSPSWSPWEKETKSCLRHQCPNAYFVPPRMSSSIPIVFLIYFV